MKIAFIIPTYNDEKNLLQLLSKVESIFLDSAYKLEFFIINDGSTNEFNVVNYIKNSTQINLKNNEGNQKAISIGLKHLNDRNENFEYIFIMDSDGEDDPNYLLKLLEKAKKFNNQKIIFASRLRRTEGFIFNLFYFFYKIIFYVLTGHKINFGNYSCIPSNHLKKIYDLPMIDFHFSAPIIKSNIPISSIPCNKGKRYSGKSSMKFTKFLIHAMKSLSVFYEEVLTRFLIFSFIGILINILFIVCIFFIKFFSENIVLGWSSNMVLGLTIIITILAFMFFASLIMLINKNTFYDQRTQRNKYTFYINDIITK
mgnify:CR=1 FL=1|tara:strand:+ start:275 stop:1213 length:939 start_codon:yes stop_codon:yes gene_type:complete